MSCKKLNNLTYDGIMYHLKMIKNLDDGRIHIYPRYLICNSKAYGKFKITKYAGKDKFNHYTFTVESIKTGYRYDAVLNNIVNGRLKDYLSPSVYGRGYLGENYKELFKKDEKLCKKLRTCWKHIFERCYSPKCKEFSIYGGQNVTVSKRWHNFSNFYKDVTNYKTFDRDKVISGILTIDKDLLQINIKNKIYDKDTCCWLTRKEQTELVDQTNANESRKVWFAYIDKNNNKKIYKGIRDFCKSHPEFTPDKIRYHIKRESLYNGSKFRYAEKHEIDKE